MNEYNKKVAKFYNALADSCDELKKKNWYYHYEISQLYTFLIPPNQKVLEIGCGTGDLLFSLKPSIGIGVDISDRMLAIAKKKYKRLKFRKAESYPTSSNQKLDYIILSDLVGILGDIQDMFMYIQKLADDDTRIIISFYNFLWEPVISLSEKIGLKIPQPPQNWLSQKDIANFLELSNLEIVKNSSYLLFPFYIPGISSFLNKYVARLPLFRHLCFIQYIIARRKFENPNHKKYSVSIIIPVRNESGNIERAVATIPKLGSRTEIIFVEDHSKDDTRRELYRVINKYKDSKDVRLFIQTNEYGKAAAVRKGFKHATGDMLFVFDGDLTNEPSDLPKFYEVLRSNKAEFIQGSRLVYPMEKQAMRFLNIVGNKFFSVIFSYLLDQRIKDTLCGTKGLMRYNYMKIIKTRDYFGTLDPFGDFDLIFGSSKLNLKIMEIPIRYKARMYGKSNINRFPHGYLLLKMTIVAARKIKFF